MREHRAAFLLAALAGMTPTAVVADLVAAPDKPHPIGDSHEVVPGSLAIALVAFSLIGMIGLLAAGRMPWRLGAIVMIGCIALLGGAAIVEGVETAIAVSR